MIFLSVFGVAALAFVFLLAAFFLSAIVSPIGESDKYRSAGYHILTSHRNFASWSDREIPLNGTTVVCSVTSCPALPLRQSRAAADPTHAASWSELPARLQPSSPHGSHRRSHRAQSRQSQRCRATERCTSVCIVRPAAS